MRWLYTMLFLTCIMRVDMLHCQTINLSDSLRQVLKAKPVPTFKFDTRNSFITGTSARVYGIKVGLSFRKTLTVGIGYNFIGTDLKEELIVGQEIRYGHIKMRYIAPFLEYSFYKKGPWEATVPVQLGFGKSFVRYDRRSDKMILNKDNVILYEPSMQFEYKILNLVGIGAGLGYRIMLLNNKQIDQQFTSPVYVIRIRLIFDEVYRRAREIKSKTDAETID